MSEHVLGIKWDSKSFFPFLFVRNFEKNSQSKDKKILSYGSEVHWLISKKKTCIGHTPDSQTYIYCNKPLDPSESYYQCFNCKTSDFQQCLLYCNPLGDFSSCKNNKTAYNYCKNRPRSVYLALIANTLKIGISFNPKKRWINQGADYAIELFRAKNGFEARKIEVALSKKFNLTQAIRVKKKISNITKTSSKSLNHFRLKAMNILDFFDSSDYVSLPSKILHQEHSLDKYYGKISELTFTPIFNNILETKILTGKIIGVKGKIIVTKHKKSYYSSNLLSLLGYFITEIDSSVTFIGQRALSDFFRK